MSFLRRNLNYANVMATLAFMLALTGGAYAVSVPKNSVGTKQLRKAAVTNAKIKKGSLKLDRFSKKAQQSLKVAGPKGDAGAPGAPGLVRAYGHVASGALDTSRDNKGIVSARASGAYNCVKLDPSIDASKASPIVSHDFSSGFGFTADFAFVLSQPFVAASSSVCSQPNEVGVATITYQYTASSSSLLYGIGPGDFFIAIP